MIKEKTNSCFLMMSGMIGQKPSCRNEKKSDNFALPQNILSKVLLPRLSVKSRGGPIQHVKPSYTTSALSILLHLFSPHIYAFCGLYQQHCISFTVPQIGYGWTRPIAPAISANCSCEVHDCTIHRYQLTKLLPL